MTRTPRKDAVLLPPLILQLDPQWFVEHNPGWWENGLNPEARRLHSELLGWAEIEFGQANIVGYSAHLDEHSPQRRSGTSTRSTRCRVLAVRHRSLLLSLAIAPRGGMSWRRSWYVVSTST